MGKKHESFDFCTKECSPNLCSYEHHSIFAKKNLKNSQSFLYTIIADRAE